MPGPSPARAVSAAALLTALVAGCASPVVVPAAPLASDPLCAVVLRYAPEVLGGLERRQTTSQGSRAWGEADPIVLRCGVPSPAPSPERCVRIEANGESIDWLAIEPDEGGWVFVTYGREPAVEVTVPAARVAAGAQPTAPLVDLGPAVAGTERTGGCL